MPVFRYRRTAEDDRDEGSAVLSAEDIEAEEEEDDFTDLVH